MSFFQKLITLLILPLLSSEIAQAITLPFIETFELNNGGFGTATAGGWVWGSPVSADGPPSARSGTKVWGTNLIGGYAPNLNAALVSPSYDLSAETGKHIVLHWWQYLVTEEGFDYAEVQVSKNDGGTWETVFGPRQGQVNTEWTQHTVLLDPSFATSGFRVRFRLITDGMVSEGGFFVDDLRLSSAAFTPATAVQDFEANDGGYVAAGTRSSWQYGAPISAPGSAKSGASVWATNLNGFYQSDENSTLTSPGIDLTAAAGQLLAVTWSHFFKTEASFDFLDLEVSPDNGGSWAVAASWSGDLSPSGWSRQQVFLDSSYATGAFRLRFRLRSDEAVQYHGVAIDDIQILSTGGLEPVAGAFAKSAPQNSPIPFTAADFRAAYTDPDGGPLKGITLTQLPTTGVLKVGGIAATLNEFISVESLGGLVYEPASDTAGAWSFDYRVANQFALSDAARVSLSILAPTSQVVITSPPAGATVNPGTAVTLSVVAVSSLPMTYEWRRNGFTLVSGPSPSFVLGPASEALEGDYEVMVSNSQSSETSSVAVLRVNDPVTIITEPGNDSVVEGGSKTFTVAATGTGRLDYQWFKNDAPLPTEISSSLLISNALESSGGTYRCEVTNVVGTKSTQPFVVTVLLKPRIVTQPTPLGLRIDRRAVLRVVAQGAGPLTYQWYKGGIEVPGATKSELSFVRVRESNIGIYTVKVSNPFGSVDSEPAPLFVMFWKDVVGIYPDILVRPAAAVGETPCPGRMSIRLMSFGYFSGALFYDGRRHALRGRLSDSLVFEQTVKRSKLSPLVLNLRLDAEGKAFDVRLTHAETTGEVVNTGRLPRHLYTTTNPAPQAGRYTVILKPDQTVAGTPVASGFLSGTVSRAGVARITGRLPNGTVLSTGGYLHSTGLLPMYSSFLRSGVTVGEVCGRLGFDPVPGGAVLVDGDLIWRNLPLVGQVIVPTPFVANIEANGSRYVRPIAPALIVSLPQSAEMFALTVEGPLADPLQRWLRIEPGNLVRLDPATDAKVRFKFNLALGRISGSFVDVMTSKSYTLHGVVNQAAQTMGGLVMRPQEVGQFTVVPRLR